VPGDDSSEFDVVVIGAGGAGSTAAFELNARGAKVALIERWKVGGTCLNVGCDPTKTLVRSAEIAHLAKTGGRFGINAESVLYDWPAVIERVNRVIDTIRGGDGEKNIRNEGIKLVKGNARFLSANEIDVNGQIIRGERFIVATGAANVAPPIEGLYEVGFITNNEAVALPRLPESLIVIGGGVIGVEFAQIFSRFGVDVTLVASRSNLLPQEDSDLTSSLADVLTHEGIKILKQVRVNRIERNGPQKVVFGDQEGETISARGEEILLATGRTPVVEGMNLEAAGVEYDKPGINVDAEMKTSSPNIWAIGDVTGIEPFTHVADYQARIAAWNVLGKGQPRHADYEVIPHVIFSDPELGSVGLTEQKAVEAGFDVKCAIVLMKDLARAITSGETEGMVKLVSDRATGHILGGHVLAAHGGELLPEIALAMRSGLTVQAIADTVHAYPTLSEAVFWAAFELAKPDEPAMEALRGVSTPMADVFEEV
jgi:mercury(II) reductase